MAASRRTTGSGSTARSPARQSIRGQRAPRRRARMASTEELYPSAFCGRSSASPTLALRLLAGKHRVRAALHLLRGHVFLVRSHPPKMPERIFELAGAGIERLPDEGLSALGSRLGDGHDLEQVAVRILEIEAASAPAGVDLAVGVAVRLTAVRNPPGLHPAQDRLELG